MYAWMFSWARVAVFTVLERDAFGVRMLRSATLLKMEDVFVRSPIETHIIFIVSCFPSTSELDESASVKCLHTCRSYHDIAQGSCLGRLTASRLDN